MSATILKFRRHPPYGKSIDRADDFVMVYTGSRAWQLAAPGPERVTSLVCPTGHDPAEFQWPVHSKVALVIPGDEERTAVYRLIVELLRAGASNVFVKFPNEDLVRYDQPRSANA